LLRQEWASRVCALGSAVRQQFIYLEPRKNRGDKELSRRVQQDLQALARRARECGADSKEVEVLEGEQAQVLSRYIGKLLALYRKALPEASDDPAARGTGNKAKDEVFQVRIDINTDVPLPLTKFHQDYVGIRATACLCGEGTIVVDSEGPPTTEQAPTYGPADTPEAVARWNEAISVQATMEVQAQFGDLLFLKGATWPGMEAGVYHRAPDCVSQGSVRRMLALVDLLTETDATAPLYSSKFQACRVSGHVQKSIFPVTAMNNDDPFSTDADASEDMVIVTPTVPWLAQ